jgi:hypothetical protein
MIRLKKRIKCKGALDIDFWGPIFPDYRETSCNLFTATSAYRDQEEGKLAALMVRLILPLDLKEPVIKFLLIIPW